MRITTALAKAALAALLMSAKLADCAGVAYAEEGFPQIIRTRYEAIDPKAGGNVIIWIELEKLWFGVNPRLSPPVKYVTVTHITPTPGSPPISFIELMPINSSTPEYFQIAGLVRLRVSGMTLKSSNIP